MFIEMLIVSTGFNKNFFSNVCSKLYCTFHKLSSHSVLLSNVIFFASTMFLLQEVITATYLPLKKFPVKNSLINLVISMSGNYR